MTVRKIILGHAPYVWTIFLSCVLMSCPFQYLKLKTVKEEAADNGTQKEKESYPELKKERKQRTQLVQFLTVKVRGLAYKAKKKDVKQFFHPLKPSSIRLPPKNKGIAYVGFKSEKELRQALNKHLTFLGKLYMYSVLQNVSLTACCRENCRRNFRILCSILWER
jgi:hypothetical protein